MEGGSSIVARLLQRGKGGIPSTIHQEYAMDLSATRERQSKVGLNADVTVDFYLISIITVVLL